MKRIILIICAAASLLPLSSCMKDREEFLVRETDEISFTSPRSQSRKITLRCQGAWKTIVPEGAQWISTTPSEGVGDGSMEFIHVNVQTNRGDSRTSTIYLENGGRQYPITVSQTDGNIVWGSLTPAGELVEGVPGEVVLTLQYSNTIGDERVELTCDSALSASPTHTTTTLDPDSGSLVMTVSGTPASSGDMLFNVSVNGSQVASAKVYVYGSDELKLKGIPVQWTFYDGKDGGAKERDKLAGLKPEWATQHYVISDDQDGAAKIEAVEASGKSIKGLSEWKYNDGHIYVKGFYINDYWLITVPVENLRKGKTIRVEGSVGGSGTSPAFFLLEYSMDGTLWTSFPNAETWTGDDVGSGTVYHIRSVDSLETSEGAFSETFVTPEKIDKGNLYIRARVNADVNVGRSGKIATGGGASTRLKGTWKVSVVE